MTPWKEAQYRVHTGAQVLQCQLDLPICRIDHLTAHEKSPTFRLETKVEMDPRQVEVDLRVEELLL